MKYQYEFVGDAFRRLVPTTQLPCHPIQKAEMAWLTAPTVAGNVFTRLSNSLLHFQYVTKLRQNSLESGVYLNQTRSDVSIIVLFT